MPDFIYLLMERHQTLDERLRRAQKRRVPDPFEIAALTKLKLAIRKRLALLSRKPSLLH